MVQLPGYRDKPLFSPPIEVGPREAIVRASFPLGTDLGLSQLGRKGFLRPLSISQARGCAQQTFLSSLPPKGPTVVFVFPLRTHSAYSFGELDEKTLTARWGPSVLGTRWLCRLCLWLLVVCWFSPLRGHPAQLQNHSFLCLRNRKRSPTESVKSAGPIEKVAWCGKSLVL